MLNHLIRCFKPSAFRCHKCNLGGGNIPCAWLGNPDTPFLVHCSRPFICWNQIWRWTEPALPRGHLPRVSGGGWHAGGVHGAAKEGPRKRDGAHPVWGKRAPGPRWAARRLQGPPSRHQAAGLIEGPLRGSGPPGESQGGAAGGHGPSLNSASPSCSSNDRSWRNVSETEEVGLWACLAANTKAQNTRRQRWWRGRVGERRAGGGAGPWPHQAHCNLEHLVPSREGAGAGLLKFPKTTGTWGEVKVRPPSSLPRRDLCSWDWGCWPKAHAETLQNKVGLKETGFSSQFYWPLTEYK